jgi:hypothetical protein
MMVMSEPLKVMIETSAAEARKLLAVVSPLSDLSEIQYKIEAAIEKQWAGMRYCRRYLEYGPKTGCEGSFFPNRKDKKYCCDDCRKASFDKTRPKRKRHGK